MDKHEIAMQPSADSSEGRKKVWYIAFSSAGHLSDCPFCRLYRTTRINIKPSSIRCVWRGGRGVVRRWVVVGGHTSGADMGGIYVSGEKNPGVLSTTKFCSAQPKPFVGGKSPHAKCMGREPGQAIGGPRVGMKGRSVGGPSLVCNVNLATQPFRICLPLACIQMVLQMMDPGWMGNLILAIRRCPKGNVCPARPARYFSVNHPGFSPRFTLSWRSPPSRPRWTAHLPDKARCIISNSCEFNNCKSKKSPRLREGPYPSQMKTSADVPGAKG